jgi:hypothetical protein
MRTTINLPDPLLVHARRRRARRPDPGAERSGDAGCGHVATDRIVCDNRPVRAAADGSASILTELTSEQREELSRSEASWRKAHAIVKNRPDLDVSDVYHVLRNLQLPPAERLRRGLTRVRVRPNPR